MPVSVACIALKYSTVISKISAFSSFPDGYYITYEHKKTIRAMVPAAREIHKQLHFDILKKVSRHIIFAEFHLMPLDVYITLKITKKLSINLTSISLARQG
jgi:hypothetical protein